MTDQDIIDTIAGTISAANGNAYTDNGEALHPYEPEVARQVFADLREAGYTIATTHQVQAPGGWVGLVAADKAEEGK